MGVAGSGKTTLGKELALTIGAEFFDADDYHSGLNIKKMQNGIPLSEADRDAWIAQIMQELTPILLSDKATIVLACSALTEKIQNIFYNYGFKLIWLVGKFEEIEERVVNRQGHFFPHNLLASQFATLEEPKYAIKIDCSTPKKLAVEHILRTVQLQKDHN